MKGVRSIPWARVLAEFVAISVGVYLGLLADNYRDYRAERASEAEYLRLIARDLQRDQKELTDTRRGVAAQTQAARLVHHALGGADLSDDELDHAFTQLFLTWTYEEQNPTFIGLRDGGQLQIIEDTALRSNLIDYYELHQKSLQQDYMAGYNRAQRRLATDLVNHVRFFPPERFKDLDLPTDQPATEWRFAKLVTPLSMLRTDVRFGNGVAELGGRGDELLQVVDQLVVLNRKLQADLAKVN